LQQLAPAGRTVEPPDEIGERTVGEPHETARRDLSPKASAILIVSTSFSGSWGYADD
jgi:hypothetical protein